MLEGPSLFSCGMPCSHGQGLMWDPSSLIRHGQCLHHRLTVHSLQMVMLYVDEETSIKRQMERAKQAHMHNKRVMDAGAGELWCVVRP
jgi:hypothetical protein